MTAWFDLLLIIKYPSWGSLYTSQYEQNVSWAFIEYPFYNFNSVFA